MMRLTQAQPNQLEEIVQMYEDVKKVMAKNNVYQWDGDYPNRDVLREDLRQGNLYVIMKDGKVAAAVALDQHTPPEYDEISWRDRSGSYLVVHRLCVNPDFQGQGISKLLVKEIENFAREKGYTSIRLDTQTANEKAMNLYESQGYEKRGEFYFPEFEIPFVAYEKELER
jgi:ribosomal protein S18 acetylase RimI-like enzyme